MSDAAAGDFVDHQRYAVCQLVTCAGAPEADVPGILVDQDADVDATRLGVG